MPITSKWEDQLNKAYYTVDGIPWRSPDAAHYYQKLPALVKDHIYEVFKYKGMSEAEFALKAHIERSRERYYEPVDPYFDRGYTTPTWSSASSSSATLKVNYNNVATAQPEPYQTELQRMTEEVEKYCRIGRKKDFA